jgi:hypothetical protein
MVGPEGLRALQLRASRRLGEPQGLPLTIEDREIELREDPHKAPRERGGPRLRPLAPERGLEGLAADLPRPAQRAVEGGQRFAQGEVPLVYSLGKA